MQTRMRQASRFTAVAITLAVALGGTALAQSGDPLVGSWKLNVAKSKGTSFKSWHYENRDGWCRRQVHRGLSRRGQYDESLDRYREL